MLYNNKRSYRISFENNAVLILCTDGTFSFIPVDLTYVASRILFFFLEDSKSPVKYFDHYPEILKFS